MGSFPTCLTDPAALLIADASSVININATACAERVIRAMPNRFAIADVVAVELEGGRARGRTDADLLKGLVNSKLIEVVKLDDSAEEYFEQLVVGPANATLDDGEAATIAFAISQKATPLLDERKATRICTTAFPSVRIASTVDIFAHPMVEKALGRKGLADAVFNALFHGRMRVLPHHLDWVITLIGAERAGTCASLPCSVRLSMRAARK
jgi:predicted nucleic acid-binding protein